MGWGEIMDLSNNLVSQFVKITNDREKHTQQQESKLFGTVAIYDDKQYVQIDGSDLLTPADSTVHIKDGERVTVSINNHTAIIDGNVTDISASNEELGIVKGQMLEIQNEFVQFKVDTEGMFLQIRNETDTKLAQLKIDVDGMFLSFEDTVDKKLAKIEVSVDEIKSSVSADGIGTVVKQNATSWGLSINGKLSGTNYTFDGNNFTIGSTTGNTTAYHAAGYSKWTHTDGSYTRIDAKGMTWSKGGTASGYHYLLHAGEYRCPSESTWTITLPSEFQGKNFKVVTSIKRIYISNDSYVTGCYFPLLSFYAEALNINKSAGTFQVYASVRAWNRTSYGGWGQLVGNGTTAGEREAMQPVVAYWAFV
jgi:hypothetical protein